MRYPFEANHGKVLFFRSKNAYLEVQKCIFEVQKCYFGVLKRWNLHKNVGNVLFWRSKLEKVGFGGHRDVDLDVTKMAVLQNL